MNIHLCTGLTMKNNHVPSYSSQFLQVKKKRTENDESCILNRFVVEKKEKISLVHLQSSYINPQTESTQLRSNNSNIALKNVNH